MKWLQTALPVIGSLGGVLVVIFGFFGDVIKLKINRKFSLEERKMAQTNEYSKLDKKLDDFMAAQKNENAELHQRLGGLESSMHVVGKNTRSLVYNDLRREISGYIRQGSIDPGVRAELKKSYDEYVKDYKDETLKAYIDELYNLRSVPAKGAE